MPTLRQLRYFDAVARLGHFGRAAEACAVSQPALSMQIKELEAELGVGLLERGPRGVALTEDGVEAARRAAAILAAVGEFVEEARGGAAPLSGPLRLGVIPSIAPYLLGPLLANLKAGYPDLRLRVSETQTDRLLRLLQEGRLDILLLALPTAGPGVATRPLFEDPFLLAAPADTPADADPNALLAMAKVLLLEDGHCLRDQALSVCADRRVGNVDAFGASTLATVAQMVAAGLGVTLLPKLAVPMEAGRQEVRLLAFPPPAPARTIGLAWRTGAARLPDVEAFAAAARAAGQAVLAQPWSAAAPI